MKKAKSLLYAYRVVLTGIHLLRTGEVQANLVDLNRMFKLPFIGELIERKRDQERGELSGLDWEFHQAELAKWEQELDRSYDRCSLPEAAPRDELHRFLVDLRTRQAVSG